MRIPVLTYHSINVTGKKYQNNDHVALLEDLKLIAQFEINIIPASTLVNWIIGGTNLDSSKKYVVLTFDDGSELDYLDWNHPSCGFLESLYTILKSYHSFIHATSFVIASPNDRKMLEKTCLNGYKLWGDSWWKKAEESGLISIENHSWDHVHPTLENIKQKNNEKGNFSLIDNIQDAKSQIDQSCDYIESLVNKKNTLFAYPYGQYNSFLTDEYFPNQQDRIMAAFTCGAKHVTQSTNIWKIPRFVCGHNWKSVEELKDIIF